MNTCLDFPQPHDPSAPRQRWCFGTPLHILQAQTPDQVRPVLDAVEQAAQAGRWCVGGLRYEAAPALDASLAGTVHPLPPGQALAWFAVYDAPLADAEQAADTLPVAVQWEAALQRPAFDAAVQRIHSAIADGDCYQINYTAPVRGRWVGDAADQPALATQALFAALRAAQPDGYVACVDTGTEQWLSVSPELFFDWDGQQLLTRPMKGTAPRGATPEADAAQAQALRSSPKERAENVMIVDLLRNDVSRIAQLHSVQVPRLFHTEALPTVWQMTSDVVAQTRPGTRLADVFAALFPCGSITGAPKRQAMRLIHALEPEARGIYCGALGLVRPGAAPGQIHATFNVPIRTVAVQADGLRCGIGSGITASAPAAAEWAEWGHKRRFLAQASMDFDIVETLALRAGQWQHQGAHLARMQGAAQHFGRPWSPAAMESALRALAAAHPAGDWRVRLALDAQGSLSTQAVALPATATPVRLRLADQPLADGVAHSEWVRFKTSRRAHYDVHTPPEGVFDTVLYNSAGEITEATRGNVAVLLDGRWVTPPLACGLLPGVGRALALEQGRVVEQVVRLQDLPRVQAWAFVNSLRGWLDAELLPG